MKNVLLLNDGKSGHFNQTKALAYALSQIQQTNTQTINIRIKKIAKYILRGLLNSKIGQGILSNPNSLKFLKLFYDIDGDIPPCDTIISSGKDTSLLNAWLGLAYGCQTIYIGNPKKLNHRLFDIIFSVLDLGFENQIVLEVAPTMPLEGDIDGFCQKYHLDKEEKYYLLLIGGDGAGYHYSEDEYENLVEFVNHAPQDIKWLVTTSRRTPKEIEKRLKQKMNTASFIDYHTNPQKVVAGFLQLASAVFVTEESASMVNEAVSFGKPVMTLFPKKHHPDKSYQRILDRFFLKKRVQRVDISKLEYGTVECNDFQVLKHTSSMEIVEKVGKYL